MENDNTKNIVKEKQAVEKSGGKINFLMMIHLVRVKLSTII